MKRKCITLFLALWLVLALPFTTFAAQDFQPDRLGSISVTLQEPTANTPVEGLSLSVYHVATVTQDSSGTLYYAYTAAFADCGIALNDPALAAKLDAYLDHNAVSSMTLVTNAEGKASCSNLTLGLYFVRQTDTVPGYAACTPFLVTVPGKTGSEYQYEINASPKTSVAKLTDITIKKVWNTDRSTPVPASVTVRLLRSGVAVETAVLSSANNWQVTFPNMPQSDAYSVVEVIVPKGYTATYSQTGYVFTVTNSAALIQTGQLIWPIPVLAMAGLVLITAGTVILRKAEGRHE